MKSGYVRASLAFLLLCLIRKSNIIPISGGRVSSPGSSGHLGTSVFDYIEKHSGRHSSFYNFLYVGDRISDSAVCILICAFLYTYIVNSSATGM